MKIQDIQTEEYNTEKHDVLYSKWPACVITGDSVTVEQAQNIILLTDNFLTDNCDYAGGNNHHWNKLAQEKLGATVPLVLKEDGFVEIEIRHKVRDEIGCLSTEYIYNSWASCAYIDGPNGWCNPMGQIDFSKNIGSWPDTGDVYNELKVIASTFDFVKMAVSLYAKETCEDDNKVLITFVICDGHVTVAREAIDLTIVKLNIDDVINNLVNNIGDTSKEQGLPDAWISEYGAITKPIWAKHYSEARKNLK